MLFGIFTDKFRLTAGNMRRAETEKSRTLQTWRDHLATHAAKTSWPESSPCETAVLSRTNVRTLQKSGRPTPGSVAIEPDHLPGEWIQVLLFLPRGISTPCTCALR